MAQPPAGSHSGGRPVSPLIAHVGRARLPVLGIEGRHVLVFHRGRVKLLDVAARAEGVALRDVTLRVGFDEEVAGLWRWVGALERRLDRALRETEAMSR